MARIEILTARLQRRAILAAALMLTAMAAAAPALADPDLVDLQVVDRATGEALPVWTHQGRLFVAGEPGARYGLRMTNRTDRRVLVVVSVDGVNIITGETAGYGQRGYVLGPHQSDEVTGWRKSNTEVAAFSFAPLPQSYAARTGRPADVGVIGMAVFNERTLIEPLATDRLPLRPAAPIAVPAPPPSAASAAGAKSGSVGEVVVTGSRIARSGFGAGASDEKLGTAHGAREWSVVETVSFARATPYPQTIRQIEYDTYDNLVASGVIPRGRSDAHRPRAFPSQPHGEGFVPDPPDDR